MSYGRMLMTGAAGVLQPAPMALQTPNTSSTSAPVTELVSFTATENSRRFSVTSLLELEDLTPAGAKRGLDTDRSEGTCPLSFVLFASSVYNPSFICVVSVGFFISAVSVSHLRH
jgi:hypothetical protein